MPFLLILTTLSIIISLFLTLGTYRTYQVQNASSQKFFLKGKIPEPPPDGNYKGTVKNIKTNWLGKSFYAQGASGINNLKENEKTVQKYPFKTYVAKGIQDRNLEVIKIDYNIPSNPFWLRLILDEVVQTEKNKLLGKVHIRFLPGVAFSLGYFTLEK